MCSNSGSITRIEFVLPHGSHPSITVLEAAGLKSHNNRAGKIGVRSKGEHSTIDQSVFSYAALSEQVECSNRGSCNYETGVCECYDGFRSSDGLGLPGNRGDCGYRYQAEFNYTRNGTTFATSCPVNFDNQICSGNGTCEESTGVCTCFSGYANPDCSRLDCSSTFAWFGNVAEDHSISAECGGIGECSETGVCTNCGGNWGVFYGERCEFLGCPVGSNGKTCSDNGACLSMREIGLMRYGEDKKLDQVFYDTPWDANIVRGCSCYRAISVDNQYDPTYHELITNFAYNETTNKSVSFSDSDLTKFYRGPYAFAATDFKGHDCSEALCPKGDSPRYKGSNEIQELNCRADNGTFRLAFRENITTPISHNATVAQFKKHLEQLYTIGQVDVTFKLGYNDSVCSIDGNRTVVIEFLTDFGDLPMLEADVMGISNLHTDIDTFANDWILNITETQKGTKKDIECSGEGMCDSKTGRCNCFTGFQSSNGTLVYPGEKGECSFFNRFYTQQFNSAKLPTS
mmetsp:Transcript_4445/g.7320  ORF Transcript_4445/g.7320 Transcript_4445/m.7320 type:complete len:515 (-) Transcript_4445:182-1726(-)